MEINTYKLITKNIWSIVEGQLFKFTTKNQQVMYGIKLYDTLLSDFIISFQKLEENQTVFFSKYNSCRNFTYSYDYFTGKDIVSNFEIIKPVEEYYFFKVKLDTGEFLIIDNGIIKKII